MTGETNKQRKKERKKDLMTSVIRVEGRLLLLLIVAVVVVVVIVETGSKDSGALAGRDLNCGQSTATDENARDSVREDVVAVAVHFTDSDASGQRCRGGYDANRRRQLVVPVAAGRVGRIGLLSITAAAAVGSHHHHVVDRSYRWIAAAVARSVSAALLLLVVAVVVRR